MNKVAVLLALMLAGCSTSNTVTLPDGTAGRVVRCNGTMNSVAGCYEEAGKACPAGYRILDEQQEHGAAAMPNGTGGVNHIPTAMRTMLVACK